MRSWLVRWKLEIAGLVVAVVLLGLLAVDVSLSNHEVAAPPCYVGPIREGNSGWLVVLRPVPCP